jgi:hypothetical protein
MAVHIEFKANVPAQRATAGTGPGSDLPGWLKSRLDDSGVTAEGPTRYDWGFEIPIRASGTLYFAGITSRKDPTQNWHLFLDKRQSIRDRIRGITMPATEPMVLLITEILSREPSLKVVRVQEQA